MASFASRGGGMGGTSRQQRPRFRAEEEEAAEEYAPLNIMCDPRVVRGRTRGPAGSAVSDASAAPQRRVRRAARPRWKQTAAEIHDSIQIAPRQRTEVPLHLYLEEQVEETPTTAASSQTDAFLEEPEEKPYVPPKSGLDAATQVETALVFDFDRDVEGILGTLVGKTLDQAQMEVAEETELELARKHRERLDAGLAAERESRLRLERAELERAAATERALAEARARDSDRRATERKLAAASFARQYLDSLQTRVLGRLERAGHFYDPVQRQVEGYMPELAAGVGAEVETVRTARRLVDLLAEAAAKSVLDERAAAEAAREREDRKRRMSIQLHIHCDMFGERPVGPLRLRALATIRDVEDKVCEWVAENLGAEGGRLSNFRFSLGTGQRLAPDAVLHDIGVDNLGDLRLELERQAAPVEEGEGEEEEEEEGGEEDE